MAVIGSFGDVVFEVSMSTVRTFDQLTRTTTGRWSDHEILNQKPVTEFEGPELDTITFNMRFDAALGISPFDEMTALTDKARTGEAAQLIIGEQILGENMWVCTSATQNWKTVDGFGNLICAEVQVNLKEYV